MFFGLLLVFKSAAACFATNKILIIFQPQLKDLSAFLATSYTLRIVFGVGDSFTFISVYALALSAIPERQVSIFQKYKTFLNICCNQFGEQLSFQGLRGDICLPDILGPRFCNRFAFLDVDLETFRKQYHCFWLLPGPAIGPLLWTWGGFTLPFVVMGCVGVFFSILIGVSFPNARRVWAVEMGTDHDNEKHKEEPIDDIAKEKARQFHVWKAIKVIVTILECLQLIKQVFYPDPFYCPALPGHADLHGRLWLHPGHAGTTRYCS